jgi:hypothetical protein
MAASYVILGSATPTAAGTSTLVTGSANGSVVGSFNVCNRGGSTDAIRVSITKSGGSAYYVYYGFNVPANSSIRETPGWTLASGDIISVYSTTGTTDFIATGSTL